MIEGVSNAVVVAVGGIIVSLALAAIYATLTGEPASIGVDLNQDGEPDAEVSFGDEGDDSEDDG